MGKFQILPYLSCKCYHHLPGLPWHAGIFFFEGGSVLAFLLDQQMGVPATSLSSMPLSSLPVFTQQDLFMLTVFKSPDGGEKDCVE